MTDQNENILVDVFGRRHDYLRISITDKCNLRCSYCIPYDLPAGFYANSIRMNTEEIDEIVSEFVGLGIKKIRITGGEPLVRKEAKHIINAISKYPVELALSSNGILVDEFIGTFQKAGIKSVNLSLDTLQPNKFLAITKRSNFEKIFSNIHLLLSNDFIVKVNVVVMKGVNDGEILDFIEWTNKFPVHIRFIEFMPFDGNKWDSKKVITHQNILEVVESKYKFSKSEDGKNSTSKNYSIKGYKGSFGVISTMSEPFCDGCNRLRLTADGKMKNCLFSKEETDLLRPLREGKDIRPLIIETVLSKKEKQGGQLNPSLSNFDASQIQNRSMLGIGG